MRRTAAIRMVFLGIGLAIVQSLLGHADLKTTLRYVHPVTEEKIRVIDALDKYNKRSPA